jgi:hypothetical protein
MIKKIFLSILVLFLITEIVGLLTHSIFLPVDILKTLPVFGQHGWAKPHNSLIADPVFQFEPWRIFAKDQIMQGNIPLWNNLNGLGVPFLANPQTSLFFPLQILYYLLPTGWSLLLAVLIKSLLYIYFLYIYLRQNKISKVSSFLVSITSWGGFFAVWLSWPHTNVFLFFPLVLYIIDKYSLKKEKKYKVLLPIVFFLAYLGGHPETFFLISFISVVYGFIRFQKTVVWVVLSIVFSLLLSAFLLVPFIEYLFNSYALMHRFTQDVLQLPLSSLVFNVVPFLLGAPHLSFYKPLLPTLNFQELSGGYTGVIAMIIAVITIIRFWKNEFVKTWLIIGVISFLFVYRLPFISYILENSFLKANANHRMSAFIGISSLMIVSYGFDRILAIKKNILTTHKVKVITLFLSALVCFYIFSFFVPLNIGGKYHDFYIFLARFILLLLFSTIFFFLILFLRRRLTKVFFVLGLTISLLSQTVFLFITYNTFSTKDYYYPENETMRYLVLHPGNTLQVGNPNFPPNMNLAYGISNAQNDDALEIVSYRTAFDKAFPEKNIWGNVDSINKKSLIDFNIANVISDYDIRNEKVSISQGTKNIYSLFEHKFAIEFTGNGRELRQVRIITATYNRVNNCYVEASLSESSNKHEVAKTIVPCGRAYDRMFLTLDIKPVILEKGVKYSLVFSEYNDSQKSSLGIVGEGEMPYLDLLFKSDALNNIRNYKKIDNLYLFTFKDRTLVKGENADIKILKNLPESLNFIVDSKSKTEIKIYKTMYPGWEANINNRKAEISPFGPFMKINVPKGKSYVAVSYHPKSLLIGFFITLISFIALAIYMFRIIYFDKNNVIYEKIFPVIMNYRKNLENVSLARVIVIAGIALFIGTFSYILLLKIIPFHFVYSDNMVINWFSEFKYPKQQDYFFYFFAFIVISIIGLFVWLFLLNKYKK